MGQEVLDTQYVDYSENVSNSLITSLILLNM